MIIHLLSILQKNFAQIKSTKCEYDMIKSFNLNFKHF